MVSGRAGRGSRAGHGRSLWMHGIVRVAQTNQVQQSERNNHHRVFDATVDRRARPQSFTGRDKARRNDFCQPHCNRRQKRCPARYHGPPARRWRASGRGRPVGAVDRSPQRDQSHCRSGWRAVDGGKRVSAACGGLRKTERISGTLRATWNSDTLAGDPRRIHFLE